MPLAAHRFSLTPRPWMLALILLTLLCGACTVSSDRPASIAPAAALAPVAALAPAAKNCMADVYGDTLNCTANDVRVAQYTLVEGPAECLPGSTIRVKLQAELIAGAQNRYDVGLFVAQDGGAALTGSCFRDYLAPPLAPVGEYQPGARFTSVPGNPPVFTGGGPFLTVEDAADQCGDIAQGVPTFRDLGEAPAGAHTGPVWVDIVCQDRVNAVGAAVPDQVADAGTCVSWDNQANASPVCASVEDTKPGTKSKCNCSFVQIAGLTVPKTARIEVKKAVIRPEDAGRFDLLIDNVVKSGAAGVGDGGATGPVEVSAGTQNAPGATHWVSEAAHPGSGTDLSNYVTTYACVRNGETAPFVSGAGIEPFQVPVMPDDNIVCAFTNRAIPRLRLNKEVVNDNGGTAAVTQWTLYATGQSGQPTNLAGPSPLDSAALGTAFQPDTYTLSEAFLDFEPGAPTGYAAGPWQCVQTASGEPVVVSPDSKVVVGYGDGITCAITNDDIQPKLTLLKTMNIQYGGTATPADFQATVTDGVTSEKVAWSGPVGLNAGSYVVGETGPAGYEASEWGGDCEPDGSITLLPGDDMTCSITNSDIQPKLRLVKTMNNRFGGTATADDFKATVTDGVTRTDMAWNTFIGLNAGTYTATEAGPAGYEGSAWGGDCAADGTVSLLPGDEKTCAITNSDIQPKLKLVKTVNNQFGDTATETDFQASVWDGSVRTDIPWNTFVGFNAGTYDVEETGPAGYSASVWMGDCREDGSIALLPGDEKVCAITNSDNPARPDGVTVMSWVLHDELTIEDLSPSTNSPASVTFMLFKDQSCKEAWMAQDAPYSETVPIQYNGSTGTAKTRTGFTVTNPAGGAPFSGIFYWQAIYSGDRNNPGFTTACGHEVSAIGGVTTIEKTGARVSLGRQLERGLTRGGYQVKPTGTTLMSWVLRDQLNITHVRPLTGSAATVTFTLYKDAACLDPWRSPAEPYAPYSEVVPITYNGASATAVTGTGYPTLTPGRFYWQATYSGDAYNFGFTTPCGHEITVIDATTKSIDTVPSPGK